MKSGEDDENPPGNGTIPIATGKEDALSPPQSPIIYMDSQEPQLQPSARDLDSAQKFRNAAQLRRELRSMELLAYSNVVGAYRASGQLTPEKSQLLTQLRKSFNIPIERHFTELRRVANDRQLDLIAKEVTGLLHTAHSWIEEAYPRTPQYLPHVSIPSSRVDLYDLAKNMTEIFSNGVYTNGMKDEEKDWYLHEELINEEDKKELQELLNGKSTNKVKTETSSLPRREPSPDIVSLSRNSKGANNTTTKTSYVRSISTSLNDLKHLLTSSKHRKRRSESPSSDSSSSTMSISEAVNEIRIGITHKPPAVENEPGSAQTIPIESPPLKIKRGRIPSIQNQSSSNKEPIKRRRKQKQPSLTSTSLANHESSLGPHIPTKKIESSIPNSIPLPHSHHESMSLTSGYQSPNSKSPILPPLPQPSSSLHIKPKVLPSLTSIGTGAATASVVAQSTPLPLTTTSSTTTIPIPTPKKRTQNLTPSTYTPMAVEEPVILTKLEAQRQEQEELQQQMQLMKKMGTANNVMNPPVLSHHQPIVIQQLLAAQAQAQQQGGIAPTLGLPVAGPAIGNTPNTGLFRKALHPHILSSPGGLKRVTNIGSPAFVASAALAPRLTHPQQISIASSIVPTSNMNVISSNYIVVHKNNNNVGNNSSTIPMPTFKPLSTPCILPSNLQQLQVVQGNPGTNNTINVLNSAPSNTTGAKAVILRRSNNLVYLDLPNNKPQIQHQAQQIQRIISTANLDPNTRIMYQRQAGIALGSSDIRPINITKGSTGVGVITSGSTPAILGGSTVVTSCASSISMSFLPTPKMQTTFVTEKQVQSPQATQKQTTLLMTEKQPKPQDNLLVSSSQPATSAIAYGSSNNNNNNRTMFTVRIDKSGKCAGSSSINDIRQFNNQSIPQKFGVILSKPNDSNKLHFAFDEGDDVEEEEEDDDVEDDEETAEEEETIELIDLVEESSSQDGNVEIPISSTKFNDDTNHNTNGKAEEDNSIVEDEHETTFCPTISTNSTIIPPPLLPNDSFVETSSNVTVQIMSPDTN